MPLCHGPKISSEIYQLIRILIRRILTFWSQSYNCEQARKNSRPLVFTLKCQVIAEVSDWRMLQLITRDLLYLEHANMLSLLNIYERARTTFIIIRKCLTWTEMKHSSLLRIKVGAKLFYAIVSWAKNFIRNLLAYQDIDKTYINILVLVL